MTTKIGIVKFLITEIETQVKYNEDYKIAEVKAREDAKKENGWWYDSMPPGFDKRPSTSILKNNSKMIRRLMLEVAKENIKNG